MSNIALSNPHIKLRYYFYHTHFFKLHFIGKSIILILKCIFLFIYIFLKGMEAGREGWKKRKDPLVPICWFTAQMP